MCTDMEECICGGTGLYYERREGTDHPYVCKGCDRYDVHELGADRFRVAKSTPGVPVVFTN